MSESILDKMQEEKDMYLTGGAIVDLIPPENLHLFGENLTPEVFEDYYDYIRALDEMGLDFTVALNKSDYPEHLQTSGAGGYFSDQDDILLSLRVMGGHSEPGLTYSVEDPADVHRFGSAFAHEVGHAVMDPTKIWPGVAMHQDKIWAATQDENRSVADYYRDKNFLTDKYDFSTGGVPLTGGTYEEAVIPYEQSVEDFYRFHDLKQQLGEQIFEVTEKTGDLFKGQYGMWGARDSNLAQHDPSWDEGILTSGYSITDQKIIDTIGHEFLAETLGDKWHEADIMKKAIINAMGDDSKMDIKDLVKISDSMEKADTLIELSRKYGGFPDEIWNLFDIWAANKGEYSSEAFKKYHGITVSNDEY
jgi:hypothetical protein